jgi:hypothetical protein
MCIIYERPYPYLLYPPDVSIMCLSGYKILFAYFSYFMLTKLWIENTGRALYLPRYFDLY